MEISYSILYFILLTLSSVEPYIYDTQLTTLPPEIGDLKNLEYLSITDNPLRNLPPEIGNLNNLEELHLLDNPLGSLPPEIGNLNNLQKLVLKRSQLSNLPPEIGNLNNLNRLFLDDNQLSSLPPEIGNLNSLCRLELQSNQLQHLPTEVGQLKGLLIARENCDLKLHDNPLLSPPPEVIAQGTPAVLDYLNHQAWWHMQRLIVSLATGLGLLAVIILGIRWRMRRRNERSKRKNDAI